MESASVARHQKLGSNLGPNADKHRIKPCSMTQRKAIRTNEIYFCSLPYKQEVAGSSPALPTNFPPSGQLDRAPLPSLGTCISQLLSSARSGTGLHTSIASRELRCCRPH